MSEPTDEQKLRLLQWVEDPAAYWEERAATAEQERRHFIDAWKMAEFKLAHARCAIGALWKSRRIYQNLDAAAIAYNDMWFKQAKQHADRIAAVWAILPRGTVIAGGKATPEQRAYLEGQQAVWKQIYDAFKATR